ncbi:hypothetical protein AAFC00_005760 [Neodothiora populina]|uniref:NADH:ubiquinone oxidoreductase intermediate-associated protein 30 domain-containing protein n=1 Tax=Neodothiora populina TaxID=2781224 RepID=A0ABR3P5R3_9PEZI
MQCTRGLMAPAGFWKRSLDEFKRQATIAINLEGIKSPTQALPLMNFASSGDIESCKIMCDSDSGGFSSATLDFLPAKSETEPAHARFHGSISTELPPNRPDIQRSGFAAWRTRDRPATLFGKSLWDLDSYAYLALKVKSDGRKYFINVQTESIVPTDIHQHRLYAKKPDEWETVVVKIDDFVRTNHGMVVEPQKDMMTQRVRSIGIGLIDRIPGPFDLCIKEIYATNDVHGKKVAKSLVKDMLAEKKQADHEPGTKTI